MQGLENYEEYRLSLKEWCFFAGVILALLFAVGFVFFDLGLPALLLAPVVILALRKPYLKRKAEKRKALFEKQFLSAIVLVGDYLKSGNSVENAVRRSLTELQDLWGETSDIVREWKRMSAAMQMSVTAEAAFQDLAERTGMEAVRTFSELFSLAKRSGGRLAEVVRKTAETMTEAFDAEEHVRSATAARRFEQNIMNVMPLGILFYVRFASPNLVEPLYTTALGRILMVVSLILYGVAIAWENRILKIRM